MSATLAATRKAVRSLTGDTDPSNFVHGNAAINERIIRKATEYGTRAGLGESWSASALSLNSSTDPPDFSFSAAVQYGSIRALRLESNGKVLVPVTSAVMEQLRNSDTTSTGEPEFYALREDTGQTVTARIYPKPNAAYTVGALISSLPAQTPTVEATVIPFSALLLGAVVESVAADLLEAVPAGQGDGVASPVSVAGLRASAAMQMLAEMDRQRRLKGSPAMVRTMVY